jgi:abortive infection bacteriophage resistance protein
VVFDQYLFDRQLRVLVMDAIERIEVSVKAQLVNLLTLRFGPFAHTNRANFPRFGPDAYREWMEKIHQQTERSKEVFLQHYRTKYNSETEIPLWMMAEIMDFGTTLTLYRNCDQYDKRAIALAYGLTAKVLESWLVSLNIVRNICAHHGRLWNRILAVPPIVPEQKHRPEFYAPRVVSGNRVFVLLCVLRYLLRTIAPRSGWAQRVEHAIKIKHPAIPVGWMGMPAGWVEYEVWR